MITDQDFATRLATLERSNRRTRMCMFASVAVAVIAVLGAAAQDSKVQEEIRVRRLIVVDANGKEGVCILGDERLSGPWTLGLRDARHSDNAVFIGKNGMCVGRQGDWCEIKFDGVEFSKNCGAEQSAKYGRERAMINRPMPKDHVSDLSLMPIEKTGLDAVLKQTASWFNTSAATMFGFSAGDDSRPIISIRGKNGEPAVILSENNGRGIVFSESGATPPSKP